LAFFQLHAQQDQRTICLQGTDKPTRFRLLGHQLAHAQGSPSGQGQPTIISKLGAFGRPVSRKGVAPTIATDKNKLSANWAMLIGLQIYKAPEPSLRKQITGELSAVLSKRTALLGSFTQQAGDCICAVLYRLD